MLTNLQKGINISKKAVELDVAHNYEEAYKTYQQALEYFMMALKCE